MFRVEDRSAMHISRFTERPLGWVLANSESSPTGLSSRPFGSCGSVAIKVQTRRSYKAALASRPHRQIG
jgi:hypothetical protein